jgi:hypothetical protein
MKSSIFWDITTCGSLKVNRRFGRACRLHLQGRRISRARNQGESRWHAGFLLGLTLKMEATCSSETSVNFQWTIWSYIPADRTLRFLLCSQKRVTGPRPETAEFSLQLHTIFFIVHFPVLKKKLRGFGPLANYSDRATAASWRSSTNFCG